MQPIRQIVGRAAPLRRSGVDTDQIIPAVWLRGVERTGYAKALFSEWRKDRSFVLNRPEYRGATILVAGPNFGIGSSRERAVWALQEGGFRAVVAPGFGDIFRNNALKCGLVPVQLSDGVVERLMAGVERDPGLEVTVSVEERKLVVPALGIEAVFPMDDFTRYRLMEGLDHVGLTLLHEGEIAAYERTRRPAWVPAIS